MQNSKNSFTFVVNKYSILVKNLFYKKLLLTNFRKIKNLIIAFLIPAIIAISFNAVINKHYHITAQGTVIEHAHPFTKTNSHTPFEKHKHTNAQFGLLALLSNTILFTVILLAVIFGLFSLQKEKHIISNTSKKKVLFLKKQQSRAPPSFS